MNNLKLSIVIPLMKNRVLMSFYQVRESFHDLTNFEIVLIDDGSEKPLIQNIKKELISDELKVIRNNFNIGQTPSIKLGIENSKGEIIALMDGDGQNPPSRSEKNCMTYFAQKI